MQTFLFTASLRASIWLGLLAPAYAEDWTLKVTDEDIVVLAKALGVRPYDEVQPLIFKLNQQIASQKLEKKKAADDETCRPKETK